MNRPTSLSADCRRFDRELNQTLDQRIDPATRTGLNAHAVECPRCAYHLDLWAEITVGDVTITGVDGTVAPPAMRRRWVHGIAIALAGGLMLMIGSGLWWDNSTGDLAKSNGRSMVGPATTRLGGGLPQTDPMARDMLQPRVFLSRQFRHRAVVWRAASDDFGRGVAPLARSIRQAACVLVVGPSSDDDFSRRTYRLSPGVVDV